jgi:ATP/maltotriose-dependent transcriptional regulator MalT
VSNPHDPFIALREAHEGARALLRDRREVEARESLGRAIEAVEVAVPRDASLVWPLMLYADLTHRLGDLAGAHKDLERALAIASESNPPPSLFHAEALCRFGVVEWTNNCLESAALRHRAGVEEGEMAGAGEEWLRYRLGELASLLVDAKEQPLVALRLARRALDLMPETRPAESGSVLAARFTLGRAQLAAGESAEAEQTFRELLEIRLRRHPGCVDDKVVAELTEWIAAARKERGVGP